MTPLNLLLLENEFILSQLQIEEALLRADSQNWCLINRGSSPAIVMGISAKPELLINQNKITSDPIPLIRRFSGGGTVVVDENTLFITFIINKSCMNIAVQPEAIMKWTETLYKTIFPSSFSLCENDYVFHEKKFGGNAQYLRKERFLHHTSFLWDFETANMDYLLMPAKKPTYRQERPHTEFLCKLKDVMPSKEFFICKAQELLARNFDVTTATKEELREILEKPHRKSTKLENRLFCNKA